MLAMNHTTSESRTKADVPLRSSVRPALPLGSLWARLKSGIVLFWLLAAWALSQSASAMTSPDVGLDTIPAAQGTFGPLLTPAQLHAVLPQVRVVDIREDDGGSSTFAAGHIPGALWAPYSSWRGPADNPGQLLAVADYTALLRRLGIGSRTRVVLVADGDSPSDFGAPARVYWTLKWLGVSHLAILNGGMLAWTQAGLGVTRKAAQVPPSAFVPHLDLSILASRKQVVQAVHDPRGVLLLDARPAAFYLGKAKAPAALQPGTLPGALNFDNARWFPRGSGELPHMAVLKRIAAGLPQPEGVEPVISFCNTGHWAATNWFILSQLLHVPNVRLYPGSMVDWSRADEPMVHVPTRTEQLLAQLRQIWQAH
jgi:thiosulfate/3-mercaptopyruvate sulfurtransferase